MEEGEEEEGEEEGEEKEEEEEEEKEEKEEEEEEEEEEEKEKGPPGREEWVGQGQDGPVQRQLVVQESWREYLYAGVCMQAERWTR